MPSNLRTGASIMRYLQTLALLLAVCGSIWSIVTLQADIDLDEAGFVKGALALFVLNAILLSSSIWLLSRRKLAARINNLSAVLKRVTAGDLTARAATDSVDELGQLARNIDMMLDKFEGLIGSISSIASELTSISSQNSDAAAKVLTAAHVQSDGMEMTSAAITGIIGSVDKINDRVIDLAGSAEINSSAINEITTSISDVRKNVSVQSEAIDEVSSSIIEMTAVMEEISQNVRSLMEASANTTSSIAEMDASNSQVEQNARETASISQEVLKDAEQGRTAVEATIAGIDEIRNSSKITFASINTLSERAAAIGSILSVIDEIAEQTNLLALNSAIIAAQAGEHGKGFAIVAGEIKGLATRTRQSTMEIASLIEAVQAETAKAVAAIRQTEEKVLEGEHLSKRSGNALDKVVSGVQMASGRVGEIARATVEQAQGGQFIHRAMKHVAEMVEQIARSCQESARTNKSIMVAVERMKAFTSQVNTSTANQQQIGGDIANSTGQMAADIELIKAACKEQSECSMQIFSSVDSVKESTYGNLDAAKIMEKGVESLRTQIDILKNEIRQVQISAGKPSDEQ